MKSFKEQYVECREYGFHGKGEPLVSPNDLPLVQQMTPEQKSALKTKFTVSCLRFGGICSSGNEACRQMRNLM